MKFTLPPFYPILDSTFLAKAGMDALELARGLVAGGAAIVQYRHKAHYSREDLETARAIGEIVQRAGALYVINDRVDVALMLGADGVHVGQDDLPPAAVRKIAGDQLIVGFSTHNEQQLRAGDSEPVDYLAIGPIFGTVSKENPDPVVGLEELKRLRGMTGKPLVAIGGIHRERAAEVLAAGADSLAVISGLVEPDGKMVVQPWLDTGRIR